MDILAETYSKQRNNDVSCFLKLHYSCCHMIESSLSANVNLSNKLLFLFENLITLFSIFLSKGILKKIELKSCKQFKVEHSGS
jgi:hypothetical protein